LLKLKDLRIVSRGIIDTIPNFRYLANLENLEIRSSRLKGFIPDFQHLANLERLYIAARGNLMEGSIPDFQYLPNLENLAITSRSIVGPIPNFQFLPKLESLVIFDCLSINDSVPDFQFLPNLNHISILYNYDFTGDIPSLLNSPKIKTFSFSGNNYFGPVPNLDHLDSISWIRLDGNNLDSIVSPITAYLASVGGNMFTFSDLKMFITDESEMTYGQMKDIPARFLKNLDTLDFKYDEEIDSCTYYLYQDGVLIDSSYNSNFDIDFTYDSLNLFHVEWINSYYYRQRLRSTEFIIGENIIEIDEFLANASSTNETSFLANNGTATCMPNGSGTYEYSWSNGAIVQEIKDLSPGEYTVTVNDQVLNKQAIDTVIVEAFECDTIMFDINVVNNSCFAVCDAILSISNIENGVGPYTYLWSNTQTTEEINGLCAGDYRVTVTDSLNCQVVNNDITIQQPNILLVNAESVNTSAIALPTGGTLPYTYLWSNGDTTQTAVDLASGIYSVTVEDGNGCQAIESVISEIQLSVDSVTNISGTLLGAIYISANVTDAAYDWTGPNGYNSTQEDIDNLIDAGCYNVNLTDLTTSLSRDTTICITNVTSVADNKLLRDVSLYPIPATDYLNIEFGTPITAVETRIYNTVGEIVYNGRQELLGGRSAKVNVIDMSSGIYLIHLITEKGDYKDKLIVCK
jgi:hypothetical protein